MAAPDAKTSPSSKEVQTSEADVAPASKEAPAVLGAEVAPASSVTAPSYESSQGSDQYMLAKSLLGSGDFEQALEVIEAAIEEHKGILTSLLPSTTEEIDPVEAVELHECMAPWHYLYGTTLLYQIEESNDTQMTVGDGSAEAEGADPSAAVEDMEIAWENLDTARNITERLAASIESSSQDARYTKLQIDLAQILLREADLQRLNGRYADAIPDYTRCLELRQQYLPSLDRQLADVQYMLGLANLSRATELQTNQEQLTPEILEQTNEHCKKGISWYLECAKTLCGQIAHFCGVNTSAIFQKEENSKATAGLKTTGLDDTQVVTADCRATLQTWRDNASRLESQDPECLQLIELLQEIQETVGEAEESQRAVREAAQIKWNAQKDVIKSDDGSTTQIGFGSAAASVAAAAAPMAAQPMMVKKKKKRPAEDCEGEASKKPKATE